MKKIFVIAFVAVVAFCSCKKEGVNLMEEIPELKGEWIWTKTYVGGVVGVVHADPTWEKVLIIDFKGNNTITVKYDDETIVSSVSYACEKVSDDTYGKYLISLPKGVRSKIAENLGFSESHIVVEGYVNLCHYVSNSSWEILELSITDVEGRDVGVEGGSDFHCCSQFVPNRIELCK